MVLRDSLGYHLHLESAIKYYLHRPPHPSQWQQWLGPNGRDRLDIKLAHMTEHQLPLSHTEQAQHHLHGQVSIHQSQYILWHVIPPSTPSPWANACTRQPSFAERALAIRSGICAVPACTAYDQYNLDNVEQNGMDRWRSHQTMAATLTQPTTTLGILTPT